MVEFFEAQSYFLKEISGTFFVIFSEKNYFKKSCHYFRKIHIFTNRKADMVIYFLEIMTKIREASQNIKNLN